MIPRILLIVGLCAVVGTDAAEASICPPICTPHPPCWPHCHSHTDIAVVRARLFTIPVARSNGDGTFAVINGDFGDDGQFEAWAQAPGVVVLTGDFDGDGFTDIALTGPPNWNTIPIAFSNGDGNFHVTNDFVGDFALWATASGVSVLAGDFNNDGRTDVALTGHSGWGSVPVAFSNGDGSFDVANAAIADFAGWAAGPFVTRLAGDFNGDGRTDIALTGHPGWNTLPVASSNGDGTFKVSNTPIADFADWAASPGAAKLVGDFDGDGRDDIALTAISGSIPVAFSTGNGSFNVTNLINLAVEYSVPTTNLTGDFNGDGLTDIANLGDPWSGPLTIFQSLGNGEFEYRWPLGTPPNCEECFLQPGVVELAGDFDGDGRTDIALTGVLGWESLPVEFSLPYQWDFHWSNEPIGDHFADWAASSKAVIVTGHFTHD